MPKSKKKLTDYYTKVKPFQEDCNFLKDSSSTQTIPLNILIYRQKFRVLSVMNFYREYTIVKVSLMSSNSNSEGEFGG